MRLDEGGPRRRCRRGGGLSPPRASHRSSRRQAAAPRKILRRPRRSAPPVSGASGVEEAFGSGAGRVGLGHCAVLRLRDAARRAPVEHEHIHPRLADKAELSTLDPLLDQHAGPAPPAGPGPGHASRLRQGCGGREMRVQPEPEAVTRSRLAAAAQGFRARFDGFKEKPCSRSSGSSRSSWQRYRAHRPSSTVVSDQTPVSPRPAVEVAVGREVLTDEARSDDLTVPGCNRTVGLGGEDRLTKAGDHERIGETRQIVKATTSTRAGRSWDMDDPVRRDEAH